MKQTNKLLLAATADDDDDAVVVVVGVLVDFILIRLFSSMRFQRPCT